MTFRLWPWSEIARLKSEAAAFEQLADRRLDFLADAVADANLHKAELDEWISTATRLRVERDQATDALAKVRG